MPRFRLKTRDTRVFRKLRDAFEKTVVVQRQKRMTYGRWDFVVFGPGKKDETVVRIGYAEHATLHRAPVYIASIAEPGMMDFHGIPIEEFIGEEAPSEYEGLEIVQIDPVRPLTLREKKVLPGLSQTGDRICKDYEDQNVAVLQAPKESDWMIAVLRYLHECDEAFPDPLQELFGSARQIIQDPSQVFDPLNRSTDFLN
ncbi:MAG: hypothetical protein GWM98_29055 [Nitrospinaceae bacterium]|nr:hypothetical protein [Nitrospinaceae bacterium]NIR57759.1 hypothetical protein [Nitrospinaceae bacterium]NIS88221.1 hypothetical protein [Nitrospinaceae bacterium]NIT85101.1 hypothetical protein [Nitrospinaceae bacterium]NIU47258.1 hypothetical protein [Nitrospinaceae bacterium]